MWLSIIAITISVVSIILAFLLFRINKKYYQAYRMNLASDNFVKLAEIFKKMPDVGPKAINNNSNDIIAHLIGISEFVDYKEFRNISSKYKYFKDWLYKDLSKKANYATTMPMVIDILNRVLRRKTKLQGGLRENVIRKLKKVIKRSV